MDTIKFNISTLICVVIVSFGIINLYGASAGKAFKNYKDNNYEASLSEYEKLLETKQNDHTLHYNAGVAAYQAGKFDKAADHFMSALSSKNKKIQQLSWYNLGNSLFKQGEKSQDLDEQIKKWELALKSYDSAIKLNTNDYDAIFNRDYVQKKLEQLKEKKQQMQQNEQQGDNKKDNKQNEQQKNQTSKDNQNSGNQQSQGQSTQAQPQETKNAEAEQKNRDQNDTQASMSQTQNTSSPTNGVTNQISQPNKAEQGRITPQEAAQLLDALKADERALLFKAEPKKQGSTGYMKTW